MFKRLPSFTKKPSKTEIVSTPKAKAKAPAPAPQLVDVPSPGMLSPGVYDIVKTAYEHINEPVARKVAISAKTKAGGTKGASKKVDELIQERDEATQKAMVLTMLYEEEAAKNDEFVAQLLRLLPEAEREKMLNRIISSPEEASGASSPKVAEDANGVGVDAEDRDNTSPTTVQAVEESEPSPSSSSPDPKSESESDTKSEAERSMDSIRKKARVLLEAESPLPPTKELEARKPAEVQVEETTNELPLNISAAEASAAATAEPAAEKATDVAVPESAVAAAEPLQHIVRALSTEMEQRQATITAQAQFLTLAANRIAESALERADCVVEMMRLQAELEDVKMKLAREREMAAQRGWFQRLFGRK